MRILHVIPDSDARDAQVFAVRLSEQISTLGHESVVVALTLGNDRPGLGVDVVGMKPRGVTATLGLRSMMRHYDVTVAHGPEAGDACARAARRSTPFVYRQVTDTRRWLRRPPEPRHAPERLRDAAAVVALSQGARADLAGRFDLPDAAFHVIPVAVAAAEFDVPSPVERHASRGRLGVADDVFVAMVVGELAPHKAVDVAIRAAVGMDGMRLVIVGDGPERIRLERLADGLGPDNIVFAGPATDRSLAYAAADVIVHPSTSGESMPTALIEAGSRGLPAIATPLGSVEEIVVDGLTGWIVPLGDVAALRAAIETATSTGEAERDLMRTAARQRCVERFDMAVVASQWVDVLDDVVAART